MAHQLGEEIVRLEGVVKRFGDFTALNGVDVSIREREVVVIIGPSCLRHDFCSFMQKIYDPQPMRARP